MKESRDVCSCAAPLVVSQREDEGGAEKADAEDVEEARVG